MVLLQALLPAAALAATVVWALLSLYVLLLHRRRERARVAIAHAVATLTRHDVTALPLDERVARIRPLIASVPRKRLMQAVTSSESTRSSAAVIAEYVVERWGLETLERDAAAHATPHEKWGRMTALRILAHHPSARRLALLQRALHDPDEDVSSMALMLLGESDDPAAADLLIAALKDRCHPASRVAAQVDRSPQRMADRLRPLLADGDPLVRRWTATLLGRYRDVPELERDLAQAADDAHPRVREAVVQSLGRIGNRLAAITALRFLNDVVPGVRAAAARAIADLDRDDLAPDVALLLGDRDWFVRLAAKECLERLGPDIWPVLVRLLDDQDRFVRNGAAEVFQNLGLLDSLIVMEAATDAPAPGKIDLIRRIVAAGELRLTDSLFERAGPALAPRIRQLLADVGIRHVGAA